MCGLPKQHTDTTHKTDLQKKEQLDKINLVY